MEDKRTKRVNINNRKTKKKKGPSKFKQQHPKLCTGIKIFFIVLMLAIIIGAGVLAGTFLGFFGNELKIGEESLVVGYENSTVYDSDGNLIATLSGGTKRKSISLSDMSEYLPKAYVAIEDERFYSHSGIDIKRTTAATVTYILHAGKSSFGGSTITQQVIKNITKEKDNKALAGVVRKIKEISKAIQVEHYLSKDQILELYLNLIFVGGDDINGVELGSIYYFDKSAKDLSIAECAFLAGINHSPNGYKPFETYEGKEDAEAKVKKMKEKIDKRTKTVLAKMKELKYITKEQYDEAIAEVENGLKFKKGEAASVTTDVSYITEAAIEQILNQILEENEDMNKDMAEMYLYSSGLKIYTTQNSKIQEAVEKEIVDKKYYSSIEYVDPNTKEKKTQYSMPTMVVEDYKTGQVVAAATATGSDKERSAITKLGYLNIPTKIKKQTGSSMKPISVIAPGLESGKITGATVFYNKETVWGPNSAEPWSPKNSTGYSYYSNMRKAIELSYNIPHAKALTVIGLETAVDFCKKVGLPDFSTEGISLALGGLHEGISPAQLCGAYSAIANDGVYKSQIFYTKVTDSKGKTLYEPKQEETVAMSEQNAYIEKDILKEPVIGSEGTATYCAIKDMDVAAKTGTTNSSYDRWLSGFTPYYSATCWYGYEHNSTVKAKNVSGNPAGKLWAAVMKEIHKDLEGAKFEEPEGIIRKSVCRISGKLPGPTCGDVYTELFTEESVPTETCEGHGSVSICNDSQLLANPGCPNVSQIYGYIPEYERDAIWVTKGAVQSTPEGTCTIHNGAASGGSSYVTEEDQVKFQAATEAAAKGLMGVDADNYINAKLQEWRNSRNPSANSNSSSDAQVNRPATEQHTHSYTTVVSQTDATCTTAGSVIKKCSCGDTKTEPIPAKGHTFNNGPTCTVCGAANPNYTANTQN